MLLFDSRGSYGWILVAPVTAMLSSCTAETWAQLNRDLDAVAEKQAADERARLEAEEQRCARRPSGAYLVGLLSLSVTPRKPDGSTWDADLRGTEKFVGKAARAAVKVLAVKTEAALIVPQSTIDWVADQADRLFTSYAKEMFSTLVAPDLIVKVTLDGVTEAAIQTENMQDSYSLVFADRRPFGFVVNMDCNTRPAAHQVVIDVVDKDVMFDDPMFRITIDPLVVAMAADDGRRGAIVAQKGDTSLGLSGYVVAAIPLGATDTPTVER